MLNRFAEDSKIECLHTEPRPSIYTRDYYNQMTRVPFSLDAQLDTPS